MNNSTEKQRTELDAQLSDYMEGLADTYNSYELPDAVHRVVVREIVGALYYPLRDVSSRYQWRGAMDNAIFTFLLLQQKSADQLI